MLKVKNKKGNNKMRIKSNLKEGSPKIYIKKGKKIRNFQTISKNPINKKHYFILKH